MHSGFFPKQCLVESSPASVSDTLLPSLPPGIAITNRGGGFTVSSLVGPWGKRAYPEDCKPVKKGPNNERASSVCLNTIVLGLHRSI